MMHGRELLEVEVREVEEEIEPDEELNYYRGRTGSLYKYLPGSAARWNIGTPGVRYSNTNRCDVIGWIKCADGCWFKGSGRLGDGEGRCDGVGYARAGMAVVAL